jgi:RNA polymerase sigma-70 factor (ECF subfamily)
MPPPNSIYPSSCPILQHAEKTSNVVVKPTLQARESSRIVTSIRGTGTAIQLEIHRVGVYSLLMSISADLERLGADEAIPLLLDRYGDKLYRLGLRVCGDEDEAYDLLQEIFLNAFKKWDQFEGRSAPTSWLYTIAVRACQRRHRLRAGEPKVMRSLEEMLPSGDAVAAVPEGKDPLSAVIARQAEERLSGALVGLPLQYRLPLILKDIAELSIQQVAQILGLKEATVKTRVHRARLQLREILDPLLPRHFTPPPDHLQTVCLDLLRAKQEALDRGVPYPVPESELCSRCEALFATLDLSREACQGLGQGHLPEEVRRLLLQALEKSGRSHWTDTSRQRTPMKPNTPAVSLKG